MPITISSIKNALQDAQIKLEDIGDSAQLEAEVLLAHTLECDRSYLRSWPEKALSSVQHTLFQQLLNRRCTGEPIAYITGQREFWDMTLQVSPDTLIPRPETEHLVELALENIPQDAQWNIADLGTGCGAIALAIARERPHCNILATDTSAAALTIAQTNARNLNVKNITFTESHWFDSVSGQSFEMIVSNPPYIHPNDEHLNLGDLRYEPLQALRSTPDGLTDLLSISETARDHLAPPGWIILEHGFDQGSAVKKTLENLGFSQVSTREDLAKNERVSIGKWNR